ncbi:MAG: hypothetical protein AAB403_03055 [Planctomycetota bacterium]
MAKNATKKMQRIEKGQMPATALTYDNLLTQHPTTSPAWIDDMHRYYAQHGRYRATDLNRLLGRPDVRTEGVAILDFSRNGVDSKK